MPECNDFTDVSDLQFVAQQHDDPSARKRAADVAILQAAVIEDAPRVKVVNKETKHRLVNVLAFQATREGEALQTLMTDTGRKVYEAAEAAYRDRACGEKLASPYQLLHVLYRRPANWVMRVPSKGAKESTPGASSALWFGNVPFTTFTVGLRPFEYHKP